jgi:hypothetical protein
MSEESKPEAISRRKALSVFGLGAALVLLAPSALMSDAEAQVGVERRQERRTRRTERRQERRTRRTERRQERRAGRTERRQERRGGREERREMRQ